MAIIKCKMCGGDIELSADKTSGICEFCGSVMTFPKIADEQTAALFNRGNEFRRAGDFDRALAVYENIIREDDTNAEAHWCCALCRFGIEYVEDPTTLEYLPTCHRASFDSFLEDVDYLAALEHADVVAKRQYQKDAIKISQVQKQILATSQNEEPFDVFICYKETDDMGQRTRDSLLAQEIYYQLTERGWRVFYSRITLEDKAGAEYEPYIFAALNSAKVMVAVGTKPEYFNAVWVKNEWSRFLSFMRKDRRKLLLPCYRDMDPYDLPEQLSVLQSYDMSKIGFLPDLIRGVEKILGKQETPSAPQVIVQSEDGSNAEKMVKRGMLALEDRDWSAADGFFDEALNHDPECAEAYLGKKLAEVRCRALKEFVQQRIILPTQKKRTLEVPKGNMAEIQDYIRKFNQYELIPRQELELAFQFHCGYSSCVSACEEALRAEEQAWQQDRHLSKALRFDGPDQKVHKALQEIITGLKENLAQARQQDAAAVKRIKEAYAAHCTEAHAACQKKFDSRMAECKELYADAQHEEETAETAEDFSEAARQFEMLGRYRDAAQAADRCRAKAAKAEAYANALERQKHARTGLDFTNCARDFEALQDYRDAEQRAAECWKQVEMHAAYMKAVHQKAEAKTAADYLACADAFEALKDYRDAALQAEACWKASIQCRKKKSAFIAAALAAVVIFVVVLLVTKLFVPKARYQDALDALDAGDQKTALAAFDKANHYSDAAEQAAELRTLLVQRNVLTAGPSGTVGICSDGTVMAVGYNDDGQCEVSGWTDITSVTASNSHTVGLCSDGTVVAVGDHDDGKCNVSSWTDIVAVSAGYHHTVGLCSDGTVVAVGNNGSGQCRVSGWRDMIAVSAGIFHTVGLKSDGTVVTAGSNSSGQGNVRDWKNIIAVAAGADDFTVGLRADGTVVATGRNSYGQLGVSGWEDIVAVAAGYGHTVGLKSDGTVVAVGDNTNGQCNVSGWTDIVAVSAGSNHTVGLRSDGTVVSTDYIDVPDSWYDYYGQCDVADWKNIRMPE